MRKFRDGMFANMQFIISATYFKVEQSETRNTIVK